jgi:hypothetical protein
MAWQHSLGDQPIRSPCRVTVFTHQQESQR